MAFNAYSYHANNYAREAWAYLAKARDIRARRARGDAYDWESIESAVELARTSMRLSLINRRIRLLQKGMK